MIFYLNFTFFIGGVLFFLIGIHDDIFKSSPFLRLFLQFVVAFVVAFKGINFNAFNFYLPFFSLINISLPEPLNYTLSAFWIVGITNAINWLDGLDAWQEVIVQFYSGIVYLNVATGNIIGILFFSIILGSIIGFLIRNFKPAFYRRLWFKLLGYCLSASSLLFLPNSSSGAMPIFYLILIFSLPLGDMFLVIVGRFLRNQNIFLPDKNHIHHRLMNLNFEYSKIIFLLFSYSAITVLIGVFYLSKK